MAEFSVRERGLTFIEYTLKTPTTWVEIHKVLSVLQQDLTERNIPIHDDTVIVIANDEEVVFRLTPDGSSAWPQ